MRCEWQDNHCCRVPWQRNSVEPVRSQRSDYALVWDFPSPDKRNAVPGNPSTPTDVREEIVRIDHEFNSKNSIFGHCIAEQIAQGFGTTMWSGDNVPTHRQYVRQPVVQRGGSLYSDHQPALLNEIAFNYNGNRINITPVGVYAAPSEFRVQPRIHGAERTGPHSLDQPHRQHWHELPIVNWMPWNNEADSYQCADDVSWTKGTHQLKIGGSCTALQEDSGPVRSNPGRLHVQWSLHWKRLRGLPAWLLQTNTARTRCRIPVTGTSMPLRLYIQDNWRTTSRLTLNLGLRWDGLPHTYEANGRESNFYPEPL